METGRPIRDSMDEDGNYDIVDEEDRKEDKVDENGNYNEEEDDNDEDSEFQSRTGTGGERHVKTIRPIRG